MQPSGSNPSATSLHFTNKAYGIVDGTQFNVTWTGASGKTTLTLQNGTADAISTADIILCKIQLFEWKELVLISAIT